MPTRFYLPSTGAAAVSPAFDAGWERTLNADRIAAVTARISSAMTNKTSPGGVLNLTEQLARQYVSAPIAAQTISGTVKSQIRGSQPSVALELTDGMGLRIVSNDGLTVRGTLLAVAKYGALPRFNDALRNKTYADGDALTSVVALDGDRIVIELGGHDVDGNAGDGTHNFGDASGTDLPEDELATAANNPWVEFSGVITFQAATPEIATRQYQAIPLRRPIQGRIVEAINLLTTVLAPAAAAAPEIATRQPQPAFLQAPVRLRPMPEPIPMILLAQQSMPPLVVPVIMMPRPARQRLPEPINLQTTVLAPAALILEVDWDNDGDFDLAVEQLAGDCFAVECVRGRDYASQLTGRSVAGELRAVLRNDTGTYSRFNAASLIFGNILPGRKVRLRLVGPAQAILWTGYLDNVLPQAVAGPFNTATLRALGPFVKLAGPNSKVSPTAQANVQTGTVIGAILDAMSWPAGDRNVQSGDVEIGRWYAEDVEALQLMQEIEDTEQGFLYEGLAWDIRFEERYDRVINKLTSQATYSDNVAATYPYLSIEQGDPLREIFNLFEATVQPHSLSALSVLWTLSGEAPVLAAGASRTYIAKVTTLSGDTVAYADAWTTPVVGTDITQVGVANGDIAVAVVKRARTMEITITNNHATVAASLTLVRARGIAVLMLNPYKVTKSNAASQTSFGRRRYPLSSPWYFSSAYAEGTGDYLIARHKDPRATLTLGFASKRNNAMTTEMVTRALSDRVTVVANDKVKMGINAAFYVETISHRFSKGTTVHETTLALSPAEVDPGYFQLDTHTLDGAKVLAY